jgi:hypothetical protein
VSTHLSGLLEAGEPALDALDGVERGPPPLLGGCCLDLLEAALHLGAEDARVADGGLPPPVGRDHEEALRCRVAVTVTASRWWVARQLNGSFALQGSCSCCYGDCCGRPTAVEREQLGSVASRGHCHRLWAMSNQLCAAKNRVATTQVPRRLAYGATCGTRLCDCVLGLDAWSVQGRMQNVLYHLTRTCPASVVHSKPAGPPQTRANSTIKALLINGRICPPQCTGIKYYTSTSSPIHETEIFA